MSRDLIAQTAARIMHEQRLQDYSLAKRKALQSLNLPAHTALPENQLINAALRSHIALFATDADRRWLQALKQAAQEASLFLADYPHVFGGSLAFAGVKDQDRLEILLYLDSPEPLLWHLQQHQIPYREQERVARISRHQEQSYPCFSFIANEVPISITVLPDKRPRVRLCDSDGSPLPELKASQLSAL